MYTQNPTIQPPQPQPTVAQPSATPQQTQQQSAPDQSIINLAKSIRDRESGGDYNATGDAGTSHGAFQFQPNTWKLYAGQILGDQNAPMTTQNQNAVVYGKLKSFKDKGWTAAQSAAAWNAGEGKAEDGSWAQNVGTTEINGQKISYNTPQYVKDVMTGYQKYKGQSQPQGNGYVNPEADAAQMSQPNSSPQSGQDATPPSQDNSQGGGFMDNLKNRISNASNDLSAGASGKINPLSGILQAAGEGAGEVGDALNSAGNFVTGGLLGKAENYIGQGVGKLAQTGVGKGVINSWQNFAQAHPEAAGDIGAIGNIATAIPLFKGFGIIKDAAGGALSKVLGRDAVSAAMADVAPKETAGTIAKGVQARGTTKSFLTGRIGVPADPRVADIAKTVVDNVPGFSKAKDLATKINLTQDTSQAMADSLKQAVIDSGSDRIYPFRELAAKIKGAEEPDSIIGTAFEKQIKPLKERVLNMAQKNGGTISSLFDTTKEFDAYVNKTYPNLWDKENHSMRDAVKSVRDTINTYIDDNLPPEVEFKKSRLIQHKLITAATNMSKKLASGVDKEIGTTRMQRFGNKHPIVKGIFKKGGKYALEGAGLGAGASIYNELKN